jgi:Helix-turn-helix.
MEGKHVMVITTRAERFECARTEFNIHGNQSIAEVAKATGLRASMISDLENNDKVRGVNYEAVAALAKHYGVFADYLIGLSDVPSRRADAQAIGNYTGLSSASVERLSHWSPVFPHERDCLDRLLSARNFPALLEALNKVERTLQSANRAIELQHQNYDAAFGLSLFEERLGLSVFRVVKAMTDICYEVFPLEETEKQLSMLSNQKQE